MAAAAAAAALVGLDRCQKSIPRGLFESIILLAAAVDDDDDECGMMPGKEGRG